MFRVFLPLLALFFVACSQTSSQFHYMALPNFKPFTQSNEFHTANSGVRVNVRSIVLEKKDEFSSDFASSVLKIRIDEETRLLIEALQRESKSILQAKGYEVVEVGGEFELLHTITLVTRESDILLDTQLLKEDAVSSKLEVILHSNAEFKSSTNSVKINTSTSLDQPVSLTYPSKNTGGVNMFKTTLSSVPTQINKGLEGPVFDIDNAFFNFYKGVLENINKGVSKANGVSTSTILPNVEQSEEIPTFNPSDNEGVIIFD